MTPTAYELKRIIAQHRGRFWCADALAGLPMAPVYLFSDQERLDSDEIEPLAKDIAAAPPRLPHHDVLIEVTNRSPDISTIVVFVTTTIEGVIVAFLFMRSRRAGKTWTDALCCAEFLADGSAECALNNSVGNDPNAGTYCDVLTGTVWRAMALLSGAGVVREGQFPRTRRRKLVKQGVSGWTYRIVDIDPQRIATMRHPAKGTHASPRWHIRRGHWRTLTNGRRIFVRECQVGSSTDGGVIKDYRVAQEAVA